MKRYRTVLCVSLFATVITSCGQGGNDAEACKRFMDKATPNLSAITDFASNWREREGTYEGATAAAEAGVAMQEVSDAATEAAKLASGKGKKLFNAVGETFEAASVAIPIRGGSVGSYEAELMVQVGDDFSAIDDFCSSQDSGN